jgi:hypothetical protein
LGFAESIRSNKNKKPENKVDQALHPNPMHKTPEKIKTNRKMWIRRRLRRLRSSRLSGLCFVASLFFLYFLGFAGPVKAHQK